MELKRCLCNFLHPIKTSSHAAQRHCVSCTPPAPFRKYFISQDCFKPVFIPSARKHFPARLRETSFPGRFYWKILFLVPPRGLNHRAAPSLSHPAKTTFPPQVHPRCAPRPQSNQFPIKSSATNLYPLAALPFHSFCVFPRRRVNKYRNWQRETATESRSKGKTRASLSLSLSFSLSLSRISRPWPCHGECVSSRVCIPCCSIDFVGCAFSAAEKREPPDKGWERQVDADNVCVRERESKSVSGNHRRPSGEARKFLFDYTRGLENFNSAAGWTR